MFNASCNSMLQSALSLQLDLAEVMCYSKTALRDEGSGSRGKFVTGGLDSPSGFGDLRSSDVVMANLPLVKEDCNVFGMMLMHHSGFF